MEYLFVLALIIFIYAIMPKPTLPKVDNNTADSVQMNVDAKVCPPHKWFSQEVLDKNGERIGWRTVCKLCGPLRND